MSITRRNSEVYTNSITTQIILIAKGERESSTCPLYKRIVKLGNLYLYLLKNSKFSIDNDTLVNEFFKIIRNETFEYLKSLDDIENLNLRDVLYKLQFHYSKLKLLAIAVEEVLLSSNKYILIILKELSFKNINNLIFNNLYKQVMVVWTDMASQFMCEGTVFKEFFVIQINKFGWNCFIIDISKTPLSREISEKILKAGKAIYYLKYFNLESPKTIKTESFQLKMDYYYIENNKYILKYLIINLQEFINISNKFYFFNNSIFRETLLDLTLNNNIITLSDIKTLIPYEASKYISPSDTFINNKEDSNDTNLLDIKVNKLLNLIINDDFIKIWQEISHRIWNLASIDKKLKECWNLTDQPITRYEMSHAIRWFRLYYYQLTCTLNDILTKSISSVDELIYSVIKCTKIAKQSMINDNELVKLINSWLINYHLDKCHIKMAKIISNVLNRGVLKNINYNSYY